MKIWLDDLMDEKDSNQMENYAVSVMDFPLFLQKNAFLCNSEK